MLGIFLYSLVNFALLVAIFRVPAIALASLLCLYAMEQWAGAMHSYFNYNSSFTNILVGLSLLLAVSIKIVRGHSVFKNYTTNFWLVITILGYAFISLQWSPGYEQGMTKWFALGPYILTIILLAPLLVTERSDLYKGMLGVIILGTVISILLFNFAEWEGRHVVLEGVKNIRGGNPLAIGQMAGYVVLATFLLNFGEKNHKINILRWVIVATCFVLAVKSGSRGQLVSVILLTLLLLPLKYSAQVDSIKRFGLVFFGGLMIIAISAWSLQNFSLESRWNQSELEEQGGGRLAMAGRLLEVWFDSPTAVIIGLGNSASYDPDIIGIYPHNVPVEILCEEGMIIFSLYILLMFRTFSSWKNTLRRLNDMPNERSALLVLGALWLYEALLSLKQGSLLGTALVLSFAILIETYSKVIERERIFSEESKNGDENSISVNVQRVILRKKNSVTSE